MRKGMSRATGVAGDEQNLPDASAGKIAHRLTQGTLALDAPRDQVGRCTQTERLETQRYADHVLERRLGRVGYVHGRAGGQFGRE